jgi:hypothetical protein
MIGIMKPLTQISFRLPEPILTIADQLVVRKRSQLIDTGRWSEATRLNRSAIIREAIEVGLRAMESKDDSHSGV